MYPYELTVGLDKIKRTNVSPGHFEVSSGQQESKTESLVSLMPAMRTNNSKGSP